MQVLNLIRPEKSDISYTFSKFPDGEIQITLGEIDHKDQVQIICRITSADELFILMQVCDILRRHGVVFYIAIYYLMSMRMDRVMDFNRPFSLSIVLGIIGNLGANHIEIYSPHSQECFQRYESTPIYELISDDASYPDLSDYQILLPDAGAKERYSYLGYHNPITCSKVRDLTTGKITEIKIDNPELITDKPIVILDDLCDGGRTFIEIAKAIKVINPNVELSIRIDHMVNPKGIENLSKNFTHVWFTNSYKDWQKEILPDNVKVIEVV